MKVKWLYVILNKEADRSLFHLLNISTL